MQDTERQSFFSLLLSHYPKERWHLCYRFRVRGREWALCSRCLGIFPAMIATILVGKLTGPWPWWAEWGVLMLAPLPAVIDWSTTAVLGKPDRKNWIRMTTGIGLGMGIGGALHVNSYALLNQPVSAQFLWIVGTVFLVRLTTYLRFGLKRRKDVKERKRARPSLEEYIRQSFDTKE
ncbi:MAG: DUF2085 domain-containing protein [Deltaproteobacteria bacterium]|nr:DUF2085 domain-containing protein [Deltaproteobacteria bacterium]